MKRFVIIAVGLAVLGAMLATDLVPLFLAPQ